jgi:hypothetical protein
MIFIPTFFGTTSPIINSSARGVVLGLSLHHKPSYSQIIVGRDFDGNPVDDRKDRSFQFPARIYLRFVKSVVDRLIRFGINCIQIFLKKSYHIRKP